MKMFRELKRIISQFVECEYWFRFRSKKIVCEDYRGKKYIRREYNALKLADTWNGDDSIFNIVDMKLSHMLYNLRKYGCESESYLDSGAIIAYGTEQDKKIIWDSIIRQMMNFSNEGCTYIDVFDFSEKMYGKESKKGAYFKVSTIPLSSQKNLLYLEDWDGYDSSGVYSCLFEVIRDKEKIHDDDCLYVKNLRSLIKEYENSYFSAVDSFTYENDTEKFLIHHAIDIPVELWKKLSPQLMKHIRGSRHKLHSLWNFRKMLRDYRAKCEELDDSAEYDKEFEKASKIKNEVERYKAFDFLLEKHYEKKKEIMRQISDYFVEESEKWWD